MDCLTYCKAKYYLANEEDGILESVQKALSRNITNIAPEMLCIFQDGLSKEPSCYWDRPVFQQTFTQLETLYIAHQDISLSDEIVERFLIGYHTYQQITDIINDIGQLNENPEIKTRLYRIPTYISIVEGCLSNLFRVIVLLLDQTTSKNLASQNNLAQLCDVLNSNGLQLLAKEINVHMRNAINHGGVLYKTVEGGSFIEFQYTRGGQQHTLQYSVYELDRIIEKAYDVASGVLLGLAGFINNHMDLISINRHEKLFLPFSLLSMELSIPDIRYRSISGLPDDKQLNVDIYIKNTDKTYILQTALLIAVLVYERYNDYQQYMIFFSNERLQTSWIRFTNAEVASLHSWTSTFEQVLHQVISRKDCLIWDVSTEDIDLQEIKYFRFPNYSAKDFRINRVADASVQDRKRLKCHLFIGNVADKEQILSIIQKSIEWLRTVKNVASPTIPHKHGDMEADALYINVYRNDKRKDKELYPSNENFVCFVDYNLDGKTTLVHGGLPVSIWQRLHHEKIGNIQIAWRDGKYITRGTKKIGVNAPCPCGSGKKFKKCCKEKDIYQQF